MRRKITNKIGYRPTWAEINLDNLRHNFLEVKKIVAPKTKILVSVKADAYGHGLIPVAKVLESCGVDFLGVASIDEGINLRKAKIKSQILVLGLILKKDIAVLLNYNLTPTVCDFDFAHALNSKAKFLRRVVRIHIKIDTGMGRIGVQCNQAFDLIKKISSLKNIAIEGIFTHFPLADVNAKFTNHQVNLLKDLNCKLKEAGILIPLVHAANSMGVLGYKSSHFNMVRPGLIIYGLYPKAQLKIKLKPVLSLKTEIIYLKSVARGFGISYGHTYVTKKNTNIATIPLGYGDGYPRNLSNKAPVLIKGRRFKISGRICMDQIMIDVGKFKLNVGDEVVLIGSQAGNTITTEELAHLALTIPYEIVCGLGSRIPRVYIKEGY